MCTPLDWNRKRTTRSENQKLMTVSNIKTVNGRKAYSYGGSFFWNSLDNDTRLIENKTCFKTHICADMKTIRGNES